MFKTTKALNLDILYVELHNGMLPLHHLVCRIIYDLLFYLLFSKQPFFSKAQVKHQRIIGLNLD